MAEESMSPAFRPGDYLLARRVRRLRRGDVLVFERHGRFMIKRLLGLPGERVTIDQDGIAVDGVRLEDESSAGSTPPFGEWRVGPGEVFVLSDNRPITLADSRTWGPITIDDFFKVMFRYNRAR